MRVPAYGLLLIRLTGLVLLFVLINAGTYILVLQRTGGGQATYLPFIVSTTVACVSAALLVWKAGDIGQDLLARSFFCLASAVIVGVVVVFLSLLIILNTLGS